MIWFTADTHFGHANIIKHSNRPYADVDAMDAAIVEAWNAAVGEKDEVWHLGDFTWRSKHPNATDYYRHQLHGRIHLLRGNHDDKDAWKGVERHVYGHLFASMHEAVYLRLMGERLYLSHYAHRVWRNSHRGSWHLYGHSHDCLPMYGRSMDVGVDVALRLYGVPRPFSFEEVRARLEAQPVTDHHPESEFDDGE